MTSLHESVRIGDQAGVLAALDSSKCEINAFDEKRRTALHLAAWRSDAPMIALLLQRGAKTKLEAMDGFTALHFAAQNGSVECCELLVAADKSLLEKKISKGGKTALHIAIGKCSVEVVRCLLIAGADITNKTKAGLDANALAMSCSKNKEEILELLQHPEAVRNECVKTVNSAGNDANVVEQSVPKKGGEEEANDIPLHKKKKIKVNEAEFLSRLNDVGEGV